MTLRTPSNWDNLLSMDRLTQLRIIPRCEKALFGWHFFDCGSFSPVIVNPRPHSLGMVGRQEDLYLKPAVGWYLTC